MWDDDERKGEGETRCRLIACSSRTAPRGPPGLTSPSDGRIAINSTICLLNCTVLIKCLNIYFLYNMDMLLIRYTAGYLSPVHILLVERCIPSTVCHNKTGGICLVVAIYIAEIDKHSLRSPSHYVVILYDSYHIKLQHNAMDCAENASQFQLQYIYIYIYMVTKSQIPVSMLRIELGTHFY